MNKTVELRVSVSTNPQVSHIGRYFMDLRDTTNGRNRQMTTRIGDADGVAGFLSNVKASAAANGVKVTFVDNTCNELSHLS